MRPAPSVLSHIPSPTLRRRLQVILGLVWLLTLHAGASSEPRMRQQRAVQPQKQITPAEVAVVQQKAEQGNAEAQNFLCLLYSVGQGVPQDHAQAAAWCRKAAEQGHATAQAALGAMYGVGQGVPQDYVQCAAWSRKAAEQGLSVAQYQLGVAYVNGQGVSQDYAQGVAWYRKAAEQGLAKAQFNLGNMYSTGRGVPQDYVEAHMWRNLAAALATGEDQKRYEEVRDSLAKAMTADQIAEAQKRASAWMATFEKRKK